MSVKTKFLLLFTLHCFIISCKNNTTVISKKDSFRISFLDENVFYNDSIFAGSKIGGLSGIEYNQHDDFYYLVCDDSKLPRFYKTRIEIKNNSIENISFDQILFLKDTSQQFLDANIVDLEAIRIHQKNKLIFTSEGSVKNGVNPAILITDSIGGFLNKYRLPSYFLTNPPSTNSPRHNAVFEGLATDINTTGYWAAMELPLEKDGEEPTVNTSGAPIRITHFSATSHSADYQFTYPLDKLTKDPNGKFGVNGVTGLIQLNEHEFLIIERSYSAGYGTQGNTVRIYLANKINATNTLDYVSLKNKKHTPVQKKLLFDFESIRHQLTNNIVDNIEGITLGPKLPNGNRSLIVVADNNFNPTAIQINQFILLELTTIP